MMSVQSKRSGGLGQYSKVIVFVLLICSGIEVQAGVANTKHNLSISGPGTLKAASEDRICVFCHTAHHASPIAPLWNRASSGAIYTPYSSSTIVSNPGQPTGASLLCLSCHDGTVALGSTTSGNIQMAGGTTVMPVTGGLLGTDLSDDHPVSFLYSSSVSSLRNELVDPATLTGPVKLDAAGMLQCTSCHNPHDNTFGKFLVMDDRGSMLCETCHKKPDWNLSPHRNSTAGWNGVGVNPWPNSTFTTVADNGCRNCHDTHSALHSQRLLTYSNEEDACTICHNGSVSPDVLTDFSKLSVHPVMSSNGVHDPNEPVVITGGRHVECVDCHNPHASGVTVGVAGLSGVTFQNTVVSPITNVYQLCFRCHGDSPNLPAPRTVRQFPQNNIKSLFDTTNSTYHPVAGTGKNLNVPSLIPPLTVNSTITCIDCHGSDSGLTNAPHGSVYSPILKLQYTATGNAAESAAAYALCYKCHDRTAILGNTSFPEHQMHIVGENAPCSVCHDAHGVSAAAGGVGSIALINFDTNVVSPSGGVINFTSTGVFSGSCQLVCHGTDHPPEIY
ncbi:MAG: hypothetical protein OEZ68_04510 [Gammaproteobacteria bacterium]|nr:hypothetical protein [Gammaproteobacteria bacterium]MDH5800051.1 hypothetical protein [Gammaproteobacteria bacterium]